MYIGIPNPNMLVPLAKMAIKNLDTGVEFEVLYNPATYTQERSVRYAMRRMLNSDGPIVQFTNGEGETLHFELFFDSLSAGSEVGGDFGDKATFAMNSVLPTLGNLIDVRDYTSKIYDLTYVDPNVHRPPLLRIKWGSLQFRGYLSACKQNFLKFDEKGRPVRARLDCTFLERVDPDKARGSNPLNSPDTTKYRRVKTGDALWALAAKEYGQSGQWRAIADANGLINPRALHSGDLLRLPALED